MVVISPLLVSCTDTQCSIAKMSLLVVDIIANLIINTPLDFSEQLCSCSTFGNQLLHYIISNKTININNW